MMKNTIGIGELVRNLRKKRGITGLELGRRVGLSQSKISKIENGYYQNLEPKEIEKIMNILDAPKTIRQQVEHALDLPRLMQGSRRQYDLYSLSKAPLTYEQQASLIRIFLFGSVPALLQTVEYRSAGLKHYGHIPDSEIGTHIEALLRRQDILWDGRHKMHLILHQSALYSVRTGQTAQIAQLDRIERTLGAPSVRIGIIPFEAGLPMAEHGPFCLYDNEHLFMATPYGDNRSDDQDIINLYLGIFSDLERLAHYEDDAKALIRKAVDYFS